jgi:hypothetical protein
VWVPTLSQDSRQKRKPTLVTNGTLFSRIS